MTTFQELGIRASLCDVLRNHGIKEATPVQEKAMPIVRAGNDCIVKAQTGTGKTLAFLLPIIEKITPQAAGTPFGPPAPPDNRPFAGQQGRPRRGR